MVLIRTSSQLCFTEINGTVTNGGNDDDDDDDDEKGKDGDKTPMKNVSKFDNKADIIYQKDASFSAVLDTRPDTETKNLVTTDRNPSANLSSDGDTSRSNYSSCVKSCGGSGVCILEASDSDDQVDSNQRCQCVLGKTGSHCQAGKNAVIYCLL